MAMHAMQGERYIGTHGPAIRDAAGWKLIVNGAGGAYAGKSWLLLCGVNFALYLWRDYHPGRTSSSTNL